MSATSSPARPRIRPVALPVEHGGWALLLEPLLLGLLAAPAPGGALLGLAALGAFLCRHPLALAASDLRRGRRYPRTGLALRFAAGYALLALAAGAAALALGGWVCWPAALLAAPLVAAQLSFDVRRQARALPAELVGAAALSALAAAVAMAGGWALAPALALWAYVAARALPSVLYVRARLRRARGEAAPAAPALLAQLAGLLAVAGLAALGLLPWPAALGPALLLARAAYLLAPGRPAPRAAIVGAQEAVFGLAYVAIALL